MATTKRMMVGCLLLLLTAGCSEEPSQAVASTGSGTSRYQPGQVWTYHTRSGEEASRATVVRVDPHKKHGHIVHLSVDKIVLKHLQNPGAYQGVIPHMALTEEAVDASVINLIASQSEPPDYARGVRALAGIIP